MLDVLVVALAGALGGTARFHLSALVARHAGEAFPFGTLLVNVAGAAAIGALAALLPPADLDGTAHMLWLGLVAGFLGAFTTVSAFSLQTLALLQGGQPWRAGLNVVGSVALCLGAAVVGFSVGAD
jgi:CrcB protein